MIDDTNTPTINTPTPKEPVAPQPVSDVVETILNNSSTVIANPPEPVGAVATPEHAPPASDTKPKKRNKIPLLIGLFLFLGAILTGAYFVAKPSSIADLRSAAYAPCEDDSECGEGQVCRANSAGQMKCVNEGGIYDGGGGGGNNECNADNCDEALGMYCNDRGRCVKELYNPTCVPACSNGYTCEGTTCVANTDTVKCGRNNDMGAPVCCNQDCPATNRVCEGKNRLECNIGGTHCTIDVNGCTEEKPEDKPLATPTSVSAICTNIKVYKNGVQVTPSTLLPSDIVVIAVLGTGDPTKAKFRVNGEQLAEDTDDDPNWTISTTKNASQEYTVTYTIPTGITTFLFEAETFAQGAWH